MRPQKFRMVTLSAIIPLDSEDCFLALDLQDAYFHKVMHPSHKRFLPFVVGQTSFQCQVLPFTLSLAQRVFSKVLSVVAAYLHHQTIVVFLYLNDWVLKGRSCQEVLSTTRRVLSLFLDLGLQLNIEKSMLTSVRNIHFIGTCLNSLACGTSLPMDRFWTLSCLVRTIQDSPQTLEAESNF